MVKRLIPNLITLGNLFCGIGACYYAVGHDYGTAAIAICAGIILDFFDGFAARLLKATSDIGKELDSLADLVTSGLAPAFIVQSILSTGLMVSYNETNVWRPLTWTISNGVALLMPLFAAYRLAKFNLDKEQRHSFRGLPTPANALIWVGLALALPSLTDYTIDYIGLDSARHRVFNEVWQLWWVYAITAVTLVTDILMVSRLPMFSLKVNLKDLSWKSNWVQYIFVLGCAAIAIPLALCHIMWIKPLWLALPLCILWYIILSIITRKKTLCQEALSK